MRTLNTFIILVACGTLTLSSCGKSSYVAKSNVNRELKFSKMAVTPQLKGPSVENLNTEELIDISLNIPSLPEETFDTDLAVLKNYSEDNMEMFSVSTFMGFNLMENAKTYLGTPYRWGGTTRNGIDCSAFVQSVYKSSLISLPRTSALQAKVGAPIRKGNLKRGDLIFFSQSPKSRISHVGMVESVSQTGEVFFIHSSSSLGVAISSLSQAYWSKRYRYGKRILVDNDDFGTLASNKH